MTTPKSAQIAQLTNKYTKNNPRRMATILIGHGVFGIRVRAPTIALRRVLVRRADKFATGLFFVSGFTWPSVPVGKYYISKTAVFTKMLYNSNAKGYNLSFVFNNNRS